MSSVSRHPQASAILLASGVQPLIRKELAHRYEVLGPLPVPTAEALIRLSPSERLCVRVLVTPGSNETPRHVMEALPRLGLISCTGTGYDGIDVDGAADLGIYVTNSPSVTSTSVAELAVGLLVASVRKMFDSHRRLRSEGLVKPWPVVRGLAGRRVGIYGLGAIGEKVARRLIGFEVELGYCSRGRRAGLPYAYFSTPAALADWADCLVVCVPATPATTASVDAEVLAALGPEGHLVNVGRGAVIDTAALCAALRNDVIAGAALDVVDPAYLDELLALPNAFLTPHIAGSTTEAEAAMCELVLENVGAFLTGREPPNRLV